MSSTKQGHDRAGWLAVYTSILADRFANDPEYSYAAAHCTPEGLAAKMTDSAERGNAADGPALKAARRRMGIAGGMRGLRDWLRANPGPNGPVGPEPAKPEPFIRRIGDGSNTVRG